MSDAGRKVGDSIEKHNAAQESGRELAERLTNERSDSHRECGESSSSFVYSDSEATGPKA